MLIIWVFYLILIAKRLLWPKKIYKLVTSKNCNLMMTIWDLQEPFMVEIKRHKSISEQTNLLTTPRLFYSYKQSNQPLWTLADPCTKISPWSPIFTLTLPLFILTFKESSFRRTTLLPITLYHATSLANHPKHQVTQFARSKKMLWNFDTFTFY